MTISTEKVRDQALTDPEALQEGIPVARPRKRGLGDVSRSDRVQEVPTASQASLTIERLHHRGENLLRQCSESGA